jgi:hypothetical protein
MTSTLSTPGMQRRMAHGLEHALERFGVVLVEVLRHLRDVIAVRRKVPGVAGFGRGPRVADVEVGDVPAFDQTAKLGNDTEFLEQSVDLPEPLAPTSTTRRGRSASFASRKSR